MLKIPWFPEGVLGPELMEKFKAQAERFGARVVTENIASVDFSQRPFVATSESGTEIKAHTVIIATGANAKLLGIDKEKELIASGAGVSACATCDGAFYKDVDVAVVGGGDSAMEEANFLTYAKRSRSFTVVKGFAPVKSWWIVRKTTRKLNGNSTKKWPSCSPKNKAS